MHLLEPNANRDKVAAAAVVYRSFLQRLIGLFDRNLANSPPKQCWLVDIPTYIVIYPLLTGIPRPNEFKNTLSVITRAKMIVLLTKNDQNMHILRVSTSMLSYRREVEYIHPNEVGKYCSIFPAPNRTKYIDINTVLV
jgi:ATP adenylyltransferase/5',5'''-P-1,P-4-tetraphosphate phosphorylase II